MFETKLRVEKTNGRWTLLAPLVYVTEGGERITVPEGFVTDFASVPRLPLMYLIAGDTAHAAAVIHDYLYRTRDRSRAEADAIFLEAMKASWEPFLRRWIMYLAVRAGGAWTWADVNPITDRSHDGDS